MNTWTITGNIKNFGVKGTKFKKLWIAVDVEGGAQTTSTVFVNFDLDSTPGSKKSRVGDAVQSILQKDKMIAIYDMTVAVLKFPRLLEDKTTWINEERIGIKGNINHISFPTGSVSQINAGFLKGKVSAHTNKKLIVEQSYQIPNQNTWKTRPVPVMIDDSIAYMFDGIDLTGRQVFVTGQVVGNNNTIYVLAKKLLTL